MKVLMLSRLPLNSRAGIPRVCRTYFDFTKHYCYCLSPQSNENISSRFLNNNKERICITNLQILNIPISFELICKSIKAIFANKYDAIIINIPDPINQIISLISFFSIRKRIYIWHAEPSRPLNYLLRPLLFISILMSSNVIFFTDSHIRSLINDFPLIKLFRNKFHTIPYGISPPISNISYIRRDFNEEDIKIVSVGRLVKYKGFENLIKAMTYLPKNYSLTIVGDGPLRESLVNQIYACSMSDRIIMKGEITSAELNNIFIESYIYVLSSISNAEAYGLSQLEAMHYSLPIINTPLRNGVNKVSLNKKTGFTSLGFEANELANAIAKINVHNYTYLSKASWSRANEMFPYQGFVDKIDMLVK